MAYSGVIMIFYCWFFLPDAEVWPALLHKLFPRVTNVYAYPRLHLPVLILTFFIFSGDGTSHLRIFTQLHSNITEHVHHLDLSGNSDHFDEFSHLLADCQRHGVSSKMMPGKNKALHCG